MKTLPIALVLIHSLVFASDGWDTRRLLPDFYAEGAGVGDLNGDGVPDIAYGPFWFAGPDFETSRRFADGEPFSITRYSDNFFSHIRDFNGDGHNDILVIGFPGKEARLYLNPGPDQIDQSWRMHIVADQVCNESPHFIDLIPGGHPEIVGARDTAYGYYQAGTDATQPWTWVPISAEGEAAKPFGHGLGVGDLNGNGRLDVVEKQFWYEQPEQPGGLWKKHRWALTAYGQGGAQILIHDVNGNGTADLITSLNAHGYGLAWFEQTAPGKFKRHDILGVASTDNPYGVTFGEIHALALADIDGDGRMDFVSGKRWFAHSGRDASGLQEAVLYWFRHTVREDGGIEFVPHLVHRDSGVGVDVTVADLNGDGKPDIISASKKGLTIHLQNDLAQGLPPLRWQVAGGRPQDDYGSGMTAEEALKRMEVPPGFSVDLIAAEPDVVQPIAMCFDSRGRLWVAEGMDYPQKRPDGEGRDRILIFEDTTGDGNFDTRKIFAENLSLVSGIAVGFGGVYVGAAPYLLFIPDADGNDQPDTDPEILLDGWGYQDTHETLNAFTWGPDGWLYGCHGVFTHSRVGTPGTPDEARAPLNAGVWRFHPVRREFEVFAHGTSNPWGVDFDARGDFFITACVIPHLYHISQGGRYQRQSGQHFNPHTFDDIKTIADHAHYAGEIRDHAFWGGNRANAPGDTSALGGGHAHCGLAIYQATEFPPVYRGDLFFANLHGHRLVQETLEREGSGFIARHRPDFVLSNDHDFIGVSIEQGPDGALYFSDWQDPQTCHHRDVEIWNRENGRIYRVRHGEAKTTALNLPAQTDADLVALLAHDNAFHARHAQRLLQERATSGKLDPASVRAALADLEAAHAGHHSIRLRAFWTAHVCGLLDEAALLARLTDPSEHLRGWAVQFLGESTLALSPGSLAAIENLSDTEPSSVTRRYLASLLQRLPHEQRWTLAARLIARPIDQFDRNIPLLCWYGIEPLIDTDAARAFTLADATQWPQLKDFIARRAAVTPEGRAALMTLLAKTSDPAVFTTRANQLLDALAQLPAVDQPAGWDKARAAGEALTGDHPAIADLVSRLGARFGDADFFPKWRALARNAQTPAAQRIAAVELLIAGRDPELGALARELLDAKPLQPVLLRALRDHPGPETAEALIARMENLAADLRTEVVNLLARQQGMALVLLRAVDEKKLPASLISTVLLDQFARFDNPEMKSIIDRHWTVGSGAGVDLAELGKAIENWKRRLTPRLMDSASASRGREVYQTTCGACHTLFGQGIALGPDLTGSNRADLNYLLENVLAPSAVVGKDYLLNIITLKDGTVVSGIVREQTSEFLKIAMAGGTTTDVKTADIAKQEELAQSLMPPGLFDALPMPQVADLIKYLASPNQVPLPGTAEAAAGSNVPPPAEGVSRIEAAQLIATAKITGGQVRAQNMGGFGPHWSADSQLWWTGAKPGDTLTLILPDIPPGSREVVLYTTTAKDYSQARILINGAIQEADWFSEKVLHSEPLVFENIPVSPAEPLKITIEITGANPAALPRFMVGLDRIEVR
jgi:putative membrane-bound dehydrogenase-like protein